MTRLGERSRHLDKTVRHHTSNSAGRLCVGEQRRRGLRMVPGASRGYGLLPEAAKPARKFPRVLFVQDGHQAHALLHATPQATTGW